MLSVLSASGQSKTIDSLKVQLSAHGTVNEAYIDLVNELSFQYLLVDPPAANEWILRGTRLSDSLDYHKGILRAMINKGSSFWTVGLFDQALEYYFMALAREPDSLTYIILCNNIGEVFKKKNQHDSAFHYLFKGLKAAEKIPGVFPSMLPANIAETYLMTGMYDSAYHYYMESYHSARKNKNDRGISYALFGLAEIAYHEGNFKLAVEYHEQALTKRRAINDRRGIIQSLHKLGQYQMETDSDGPVLLYFDEAERIAREMGVQDLLSFSLKLKSKYFHIRKDYEKAIQYLIEHQTLKDSLETAGFTNNLNNIKAALSAEIKETQNRLLIQQQAKNNKSLKVQGVMLMVILLIMVVLLVLLNRYFKNLQYAKKTGKDLTELNQLILHKNTEIEEINGRLDQQLLTTGKLLAESEKLSRLGGWTYDLKTSEMYWTDEMYRQLGISRELKPSLQLIKKTVGKAEYHKIKIAVKTLLREHKEQTTDIFLKTISVSRTLSIKLIPEFRDRQLVRIYGSNHDITEAINNEKKEVAILQSLFGFSKKANLREVSFKTFIRDMLKESVHTLEIDRISFWLHNDEEKAIYCYCRYDKSDDFFEENGCLKEAVYPLYFQALRNNRIIAAHDALLDDRTVEFADNYFAENNIRSTLDSRVILNGKFLGVVCFEKTGTPVTWTYSDQRYAGTISELIANAFSISQNLILEKEKGNLINKLLKRNQNLKEFAYVVSHNLRDPVTQILGLSSIYGKAAGKELDDEIIPRIQNSAHNLDKVIKDLTLVLRQQDESQEKPQEILLAESFALAEANVEEEIRTISPTIHKNFEEGFTLAIQPSILFNILYNLLSNSLKYRREDTQLKVTLSAKKESDSSVIIFTDNGKGIDLARFRDKIFKMYERFHLDIDGNGLGLYLVKNQIENMGGTIEVESEPGKGTSFIIRIANMTGTDLSEKPDHNLLQNFVS